MISSEKEGRQSGRPENDTRVRRNFPIVAMTQVLFQSEPMRRLFFRQLDIPSNPHPLEDHYGMKKKPLPSGGVYMRYLTAACLFDSRGNVAPADHPIVTWLRDLAIEYFVIHKGITCVKPEDSEHFRMISKTWHFTPWFMLPVAACLDYFLNPIGRLQRESQAARDEIARLNLQRFSILRENRSVEQRDAEEENDRLKKQMRILRGMRRHETEKDRITSLNQQIAALTAKQRVAKKRYDSARKAHKPSPQFIERFHEIAEAILIAEKRKSELRDAARAAISQLKNLRHPLTNLSEWEKQALKVIAASDVYEQRTVPLQEPDQQLAADVAHQQVKVAHGHRGDDNGAAGDWRDDIFSAKESPGDFIKWPVNIVTETGHDLWPLLRDPSFCVYVYDALQRCIVNVNDEFAYVDGSIFEEHRASLGSDRDLHLKNFASWRQFWRDIRQHPLDFLLPLASQARLEETTPRRRAQNRLASATKVSCPTDESVHCWRNIMIATIMRYEHETSHDLDPRHVCRLMGSSWASGVFRYVETHGRSVWSSHNHYNDYNPIFSVPENRPLTIWQYDSTRDEKTSYQFYENYAALCRIRRYLRTGTPPLELPMAPFSATEGSMPILGEEDASVIEERGAFLNLWTMIEKVERRRRRWSIHIAPRNLSKPCEITAIVGEESKTFLLPSITIEWAQWGSAPGSVVVMSEDLNDITGIQFTPLLVIDNRGRVWPTSFFFQAQFPAFPCSSTCSNTSDHIVEKKWRGGMGDIVTLLTLLNADPRSTLDHISRVTGQCCGCSRTRRVPTEASAPSLQNAPTASMMPSTTDAEINQQNARRNKATSLREEDDDGDEAEEEEPPTKKHASEKKSKNGGIGATCAKRLRLKEVVPMRHVAFV